MGESFDRTLDVETPGPSARPTAQREPHLLVLLECDRPLSLSTRHRLGSGGRAILGRGVIRTASRSGDYRGTQLEVRIPDARMSQTHARLEGALGRWKIIDAGSKNGVRVNDSVVHEHALSHGDLLELGHTLFMYEEAPHGEGPDDLDAAVAGVPSSGLGTLMPALAADFEKLSRLASTGLSVLVLGETGTGKEVLAQALHAVSGRTGKFVGVNSSAIPQALLESELFGSTRGAFSGSVADRIGLVRSADRGTLFLDEIGDLPLPSQAAFLRVLQEKRVRPVGGTDAISVDMRLVSATNRNLEALVREGKFREDLFGRIAGFRLNLPPLRERKQDLGLLIGSLLARVAGSRSGNVTLSIEAARALFAYRFPLNIRELENWLMTGSALAGDSPIRREHFPGPVDIGADGEDAAAAGQDRPLSPEQQEHRATIVELLHEHRGNVSAVARATGKARNQVQRWLRRYKLDPVDYR